MVLTANINTNYFILLLGVTLTSILFLLLGFVGAQRVKTFNQYILVIPMFLMPLCIPLIDYFGIWKSPLMWVIQSQSSLTLMNAAFSQEAIWKIILSILILLVSIFLAYKWAEREYRKRMTE